MPLVFQYGSNTSQRRLNSAERLNNTARFVDTAWTVDDYELDFTVWSRGNKCAAAALGPGKGRKIWGVLYEIPEERIYRDKRPPGTKCLDQVEGEGSNYKRIETDVRCSDGSIVKAITYISLKQIEGIKTSADYVSHIINGLKEHDAPAEYMNYVWERIVNNNPALEDL